VTVGLAPYAVTIAFLVLVAVMPIWPWSRRFGARPALSLGIVFTLVAVFAAIGGFGAPA
jgi:hypothetical protein